ncbi:MAG: DUF4124 domain-containing protein [Rhodocyclaceae bacterium]|nr:DUF4124 domain-containing protein [Rhodocyclaceae bacterium]
MPFKLLVFAFSLLSLSSYAEVFRWQDASGKIHYGERPPTGAKEARKLPPAPGGVVAEPKKEEGKTVAPAQSERQKQALAEQQAIRERNCQQARANLAGIEAGTIRFIVDEKGERIALDGPAREKELARARQAVDDWCAPPGGKAP